MATKVLEPGDEGFDWSQYDKWHAGVGADPVAAAKQSLKRADELFGSYPHQTPEQVDISGVENYHPGLSDSVLGAKVKGFAEGAEEPLWETTKGFAHSPVDVAKGLMAAPGQWLKGMASPEGLPRLVADPSLLKETPAMLESAAEEVVGNPREAGSLLGQLLIGKYTPAAMGKVGEAGQAAKAAIGQVPDVASTVAGKLPFVGKYMRMAQALRKVAGMGGGAAEEAATEAPMGGFAQQSKAPYINRPEVPYRGPATAGEQYWPERETAWAEPHPAAVISPERVRAAGGGAPWVVQPEEAAAETAQQMASRAVHEPRARAGGYQSAARAYKLPKAWEPFVKP